MPSKPSAAPRGEQEQTSPGVCAFYMTNSATQSWYSSNVALHLSTVQSST
jgi:hypothetical protein